MMELNPMLTERLIKDAAIRRQVTKESHLWFFHLYFSHYVQYEIAPFHREIFATTEDPEAKTSVILAFRGSAKSTIISMSYPIWSILGKLEKKFVLILGLTQHQARQHLKNIKDELERNQLLRNDLGPFEEREEWNAYSLVIPKYGAKIMAVSTDQSVRGLRHGPHRPDLIICDDIEDLVSVKTKESRDKVDAFVSGEVIPAGDRNTKVIFVGNLLHEDSLLMRLKDRIEADELEGTFQRYPLLDENGVPLWPGKFPSTQYIEKEKKRVGDESSWHREYLLTILSTAERVIRPEWIQFYDEHPTIQQDGYFCTAIGIDLAISLRDSADYTAMVAARIFHENGVRKIYILPNPINERLTSLETLDRAKHMADILDKKSKTRIFIEDVGYQGSLVEHLKEASYKAEGVKLKGSDKRSRLALAARAVQDGTVVFPRHGCEDLIDQMVNFGIEKHDDLADAFSMLVLQATSIKRRRAIFVTLDDSWLYKSSF